MKRHNAEAASLKLAETTDADLARAKALAEGTGLSVSALVRLLL